MGKSKQRVFPFQKAAGPSTMPTANKNHGINPVHIYQKNLSSLKRRWPELAGQIQSTPNSDEYSLQINIGSPPNVYIKKLNKSFYTGNPIRDSEEQLKSLGLKNTRIAIFLGMGLGYEVMAFGAKYASTQNTNHILIVEKDLELFRTAMQAVDLSQIFESPGVELMVGFDSDKMYPILRDYFEKQSRFVLLKAMNPVYHTSSLMMEKDYYLNVLRSIREAGTHQVLNFGNDPHDSLIGVENMLENLGEIIRNPGINRLYDKFAGKPAIIVSTGPSLNKTKHLIKGLEDRALILCPDTSLKVLLDTGIRPHMVMSLERTASNAKLLQGFSHEQVSDVYLAACPVVMKEAYEGYPGPRIIVYRDFDHFKWLGVDRGILTIQKSGSNMAFKVAEALGCTPIILVGQDLAFGEDGKTHAAGTARGDGGEKLDVFKQRGTLEVKGNYQEKVMTSVVWHNFLKVFEMDIANFNGICINSTAGGAYIPGTKLMSFEDVIATYLQEEFAPRTIIQEELSQFKPSNVTEDMQKVARLIQETIPDIEAIIECCRNGIAVWESYKDELEECMKHPEQIATIRGRLSRIVADITRYKDEARQHKRTFQLFLTHVFQSFHIQHEMSLVGIPSNYDDYDLARVEIALRQAEWYAVIGDLSTLCLHSLQKAGSKIDALLNERERLQP